MGAYLRGSADPLVDEHDVALLDLDGVVYVGADAVPGVPDALATVRAAGMRLTFVTNNAARPPAVVAAHLTELGINAVPGEVVTSAQAAARYLAESLPEGAKVLVLGTTGLVEALADCRLVPVDTAEDDVAAVVQGYSPDMNWRLLAEGSVAINRGARWVATNVDPTVPSPRGPLPGNGSLVAALHRATGATPIVTGKPDPAMHRESVSRSRAVTPIVVGDRLDTDIEGANAVGCPSLLVFSGVTTVAELLRAEPNLRPTYVAATLAGLLDAHLEPEQIDDGVRCGRWRVTQREDRLVLTGATELAGSVQPGPNRSSAKDKQPEAVHSPGLDADTLDAVRALCAASWLAMDSAASKAAGGRHAALSIEAADAGDAGAAVLDQLGLVGLAGA